ncbi:hypothetical protein [Microvirga sp. M2]
MLDAMAGFWCVTAGHAQLRIVEVEQIEQVVNRIRRAIKQTN